MRRALLVAIATACAGPLPPRPEVLVRSAGIAPADVERHVRALCEIGPRPASDPAAVERTLAYLDDLLRGWGYATREQVFAGDVQSVEEQRPDPDGPVTGRLLSVRTQRLRNLVAERRGVGRPDIVVELGAHYDTVAGSPGADDNASGVAVLLEVARVLSDAPVRRTVRFCFFAAEEHGLQGSREHLRRPPPAFESLRDGALVVDMAGFTSPEPGSQDFPVRIPLLLDPPDTGDWLLILGDGGSAPLADHFERAAARYEPGLPIWGIKRLAGLSDEGGRSDHHSYWEAGQRAILVNDTAGLRSPHYHAPTDTPDTLDYAFLAAVARAACAWTLERADLPIAASHPERGR